MAAQADIDKVRDWVGDLPDSQTIYLTLQRYDGDVDLAALAILRRRRTELASTITEVTEFAVAGDASWKTGQVTSQQLSALDRLIAHLEARTEAVTTPVLPTVTTGRLIRPGTWRSVT